MSHRSSVAGLAILTAVVALPSPVLARPVPMPITDQPCTTDGTVAPAILRRMPIANTALQLDAPRREPSSAEARLARRSTNLNRLIQTSICIGC